MHLRARTTSEGNKEESRIAKRAMGEEEMGAVWHGSPYCPDRSMSSFTGMITRLKFHRESIFAIVKTSRVQPGKNGRRDLRKDRRGYIISAVTGSAETFVSFLFVILVKSLIFRIFFRLSL